MTLPLYITDHHVALRLVVVQVISVAHTTKSAVTLIDL